MSEWLSTRQAAEFIGVSEASVRRWSDSGALRVRRVGRRGERRFRLDDLEGFQRRDRPAPPSLERQAAFGGTTLGPYTHIATVYDSDAGRLRLTGPFLRDGLMAGQPCFLIADGQVKEAYLDWLRGVPGLGLEAALESGQLKIVSSPGTTIDEALGFWEQGLWAALEGRPEMIRGVGEAASVRELFRSEAEMLAYEMAINPVHKRFPVIVVCQYDARQFTGQALLTALRAHPDNLAMPLRSLIS